MFVVGRRPDASEFGVERCGVELTDRRAVKVDAASRSSQANIYAVGDVTDRINLTPVAIREGAAFAESLFNKTPTIVDHTDIATAVFGTPELGVVGLTEERARALHPRVDIYRTAFRPMKATM